jgi:hypothetical protein
MVPHWWNINESLIWKICLCWQRKKTEFSLMKYRWKKSMVPHWWNINESLIWKICLCWQRKKTEFSLMKYRWKKSMVPHWWNINESLMFFAFKNFINETSMKNRRSVDEFFIHQNFFGPSMKHWYFIDSSHTGILI